MKYLQTRTINLNTCKTSSKYFHFLVVWGEWVTKFNGLLSDSGHRVHIIYIIPPEEFWTTLWLTSACENFITSLKACDAIKHDFCMSSTSAGDLNTRSAWTNVRILSTPLNLFSRKRFVIYFAWNSGWAGFLKSYHNVKLEFLLRNLLMYLSKSSMLNAWSTPVNSIAPSIPDRGPSHSSLVTSLLGTKRVDLCDGSSSWGWDSNSNRLLGSRNPERYRKSVFWRNGYGISCVMNCFPAEGITTKCGFWDLMAVCLLMNSMSLCRRRRNSSWVTPGVTSPFLSRCGWVWAAGWPKLRYSTNRCKSCEVDSRSEKHKKNCEMNTGNNSNSFSHGSFGCDFKNAISILFHWLVSSDLLVW